MPRIRRNHSVRSTHPSTSLPAACIHHSFSMSYPALTPSRPAPPAPQRRPADNLFAVGPSSPAGSAYNSSYTGIGGSPERTSGPGSSSSGQPTVRRGFVNVKEDGFASWLWNRKWLVLRDQTLTFHKNEVCLSESPLESLALHTQRKLTRRNLCRPRTRRIPRF